MNINHSTIQCVFYVYIDIYLYIYIYIYMRTHTYIYIYIYEWSIKTNNGPYFYRGPKNKLIFVDARGWGSNFDHHPHLTVLRGWSLNCDDLRSALANENGPKKLANQEHETNKTCKEPKKLATHLDGSCWDGLIEWRCPQGDVLQS